MGLVATRALEEGLVGAGLVSLMVLDGTGGLMEGSLEANSSVTSATTKVMVGYSL